MFSNTDVFLRGLCEARSLPQACKDQGDRPTWCSLRTRKWQNPHFKSDLSMRVCCQVSPKRAVALVGRTCRKKRRNPRHNHVVVVIRSYETRTTCNTAPILDATRQNASWCRPASSYNITPHTHTHSRASGGDSEVPAHRRQG